MMAKLVILAVFLMMLSPTYGQLQAYANGVYTNADAAEPLAKMLTFKCNTEREKVEAIFNWIANNIAYQVRPWNTRARRQTKYEVEDPSDIATILKPLDERVADLVIRRREAYCDGYARLFKTLCDFSGLKAAVVTGYSPVSMDKAGKKFTSNHSWNAVNIDSTWHLLDVTWATGFTTFAGNEFIRRTNAYYFLTPPQQFINDHYPEDLKWTLLADPPLLREFNLAPYKHQGFIRTQITAYKPEKGIIEASIGDTVSIELETTYQQTEIANIDSASVMQDVLLVNPLIKPPVGWAYLQPASQLPGKLVYNFVVKNNKVEYLNLVYNDYMVMRYRLKILKPAPIMAAN